jgi:hypothetical protein
MMSRGVWRVWRVLAGESLSQHLLASPGRPLVRLRRAAAIQAKPLCKYSSELVEIGSPHHMPLTWRRIPWQIQ